jgi:hypothetical protein
MPVISSKTIASLRALAFSTTFLETKLRNCLVLSVLLFPYFEESLRRILTSPRLNERTMLPVFSPMATTFVMS